MNKKGFTLIELIATIAILGVLLSITFVSVHGFIDKSKVEECKITLGNIEKAAQEYITDNRYTPLGNNSILVSDLKSKGYLKSSQNVIIDKDKNEINLNNIKIGFTLNDDYTVKETKILDSNNSVILCE